MILLTDDECGDDDDYSDDTHCERCNGDGMDPWNDYLLPCPLCSSEQRPNSLLYARTGDGK